MCRSLAMRANCACSVDACFDLLCPYPKPPSSATPRACTHAELWDPETEEFTLLASLETPRNYHAVAVLLADGRVFSGGGGLCGDGCTANHPNGEIFSPPYLFDADGELAKRPEIEVSAKQADHGDDLTVTADEALASIAIVRFSTATHSLNTDQRRLELCGAASRPCGAGPEYEVQVPEDPGVALGGNWMVFGVNEAGVPSVSATLHIGA